MSGPGEGIEVRRLGPADAGVYVALRRAMLVESPHAFSSGPGDDRASDVEACRERLRAGDNAIVGGFAGGGLVASAGLYREVHAKLSHRANIWGVYVSPRWRGRGLGEAVVRGAIEVARSWPGVETVALSVTATAGPALRLYRRLGFVPWGREPDALRVDGVSLDEFHMRLTLGEPG